MKSRKVQLIALAFCTLFISSPSVANERSIPMIGLDEKGQTVELPVKIPFFKKRFRKAFRAINGVSLSSLDQVIESDQPWYLDKMEVGLGLAASVGLGDVVKAKAEPGIIFVFKHNRGGQ